MITHIPAANRYHADHGWLKTHYLFSFADYYDLANMNFGNLRVFNDDSIAAHNGFGEHAHDNMEIVTIVLKGELTHKDSLGNKGTIKAGEVQHMSAGSGITHAEMNESNTPVHLYQIWIAPRAFNLSSRYRQKDFSDMEKNRLVAVASGEEKAGALSMQTDATIYLAEMEAGKSLEHKIKSSRGVFVYLTKGNIAINKTTLAPGDQARISEEDMITVDAQSSAKFVLIDVPLM